MLLLTLLVNRILQCNSKQFSKHLVLNIQLLWIYLLFASQCDSNEFMLYTRGCHVHLLKSSALVLRSLRLANRHLE